MSPRGAPACKFYTFLLLSLTGFAGSAEQQSDDLAQSLPETNMSVSDRTGPAPMFPHLRGQTAEYLYWALVDFKQGTRPTSVMTSLVAPLSDQDLRDLAAFYAQSVNREKAGVAPPAATAAPELLASGERLYLHGDAARGVPPCQGCHGADGEGWPNAASASLRAYPALAGQHQAYLVTKLDEYRNGQLADSTNDFIMTGVARNLDDESVRAIAAWLSAQAL